MKIIAFIPSRYGSTRFPGKPLAPILGKPMIQHVYHCAGACPEVSEVYVATDDERILQCVKDFGGKAVLTSRRHASGSDRIAEAAVKIINRYDINKNLSVWAQLPLEEGGVTLLGHVEYKGRTFHDFERYKAR